KGGFYSALDADSEGVEGKYYVWSKKEIDNLLRDDADMFAEIYNIYEEGNWEHTNILWLKEGVEVHAKKLGVAVGVLKNKLRQHKEILFRERQSRIRPGLDDKILLSWNALMVTACCKAY